MSPKEAWPFGKCTISVIVVLLCTCLGVVPAWKGVCPILCFGIPIGNKGELSFLIRYIIALVNAITANTTFLTDLILRFACRSTVVITRRKHLFPTLCAPLCSYSRVVLWWSHNLQIAKIEKSYAYFYVTSLAHLWQGICFLLRYDIRICPKLMLWQLNHLHLEILTGFRYRAVYQTVTYFHFII